MGYDDDKELSFIKFCILSLDDKACSLYIGFDRYNSEQLYDDSGHDNKATLANGASLSKLPGSCGVCLQLLGGEIILDGKRFEGKSSLINYAIIVISRVYFKNLATNSRSRCIFTIS